VVNGDAGTVATSLAHVGDVDAGPITHKMHVKNSRRGEDLGIGQLLPDAISIAVCSALPFVIVLCGLISESEADGGQFEDDDVNFSCLHVPFSEGNGDGARN